MNDLEIKRDYLVVKQNDLIQKSRFKLSLQEQKMIAYICSMIKPTEYDNSYILEYNFNIREYCRICGIDFENGKNYTDLKDALKRLSDRSMWLKQNDNEVLCRWLSKVWINKRSGIVRVRLDEDLIPYLFALQERFTQYQLFYILAMKSSFSIRLYEILKSYAYQKSKIFEIEELKILLGLESVASYRQFAPFRQKVLEKASEEINQYTDLNITFEPIKYRRKVIKIKFFIEFKNPMEKFLVGKSVNQKIEKAAE